MIRGRGVVRRHGLCLWKRRSQALFMEKPRETGSSGSLHTSAQAMWALAARSYSSSRSEREREVCEKLRISCGGNWQAVTEMNVKDAKGEELLEEHGHSLLRLLRATYTKEEMQSFASLPEDGLRRTAGAWDSLEAQREFLDSIRETVGASGPQGWADVRVADVKRQGGAGLLYRYGNSLAKLLAAVYPESHSAEGHERKKKRQGYWSLKENRREFLLGVAEKRGIGGRDGWKEVTVRDIRDEGGSGLLQQFNGSLFHALQDAFGNDDREEWAVEKCRRVLPRNHWLEEENVRNFLEKVKEEYEMETSQDWMRLSKKQLKAMNGAGLLDYMSLQEALLLAFPKENWQAEETATIGAGKKSSQRELMVSIRRLFSSADSQQADERQVLIGSKLVNV